MNDRQYQKPVAPYDPSVDREHEAQRMPPEAVIYKSGHFEKGTLLFLFFSFFYAFPLLVSSALALMYSISLEHNQHVGWYLFGAWVFTLSLTVIVSLSFYFVPLNITIYTNRIEIEGLAKRARVEKGEIAKITRGGIATVIWLRRGNLWRGRGVLIHALSEEAYGKLLDFWRSQIE